MSARSHRLSSQTRDGLAVVALFAAVVVLTLVFVWLVPLELTPPRVG